MADSTDPLILEAARRMLYGWPCVQHARNCALCEGKAQQIADLVQCQVEAAVAKERAESDRLRKSRDDLMNYWYPILGYSCANEMWYPVAGDSRAFPAPAIRARGAK